jgi:hypothetical protein
MARSITDKLSNVTWKGYIGPGNVLSLTQYFAVPKGESDIRMVYDASVLGINDCLWVPSFVFPGTETLVDQMDSES